VPWGISPSCRSADLQVRSYHRIDDEDECCRLVDANRFTRRAQFPGGTPDPTDSRTLQRLARRDLPKESIRDFLRSVEGQQKQAMREGTP